MKNDAKRIVRNYYILETVFVISCIVLIVILALSNSFLMILSPFVIGFISFNIHKLYFQKYITDILDKELDAVKFGDVITLLGKNVHWATRAKAKIGLGEYESGIILWKSWYNYTKRIDLKFIALNNLAVFYFEMRDFDNLQNILSEIKNLKKSDYKMNPIIKSNLDLFESFLDKDFDNCFCVLEKRLYDDSKLDDQHNFKLLANKMKYAVVCYECGNYAKAKECFLYIIETAPKLLGYKYIAQKYVETIDKNDSSVLDSLDFESSNYDIETEFVARKKEIFKQSITIIIAVIIYIFLFLYYIFFFL